MRQRRRARGRPAARRRRRCARRARRRPGRSPAPAGRRPRRATWTRTRRARRGTRRCASARGVRRCPARRRPEARASRPRAAAPGGGRPGTRPRRAGGGARATSRTFSSTQARACGSSREAHAEGLREARGREVVVRGAQTAADDEQVGLAGEAVLSAAVSRSRVVGDGEHARDLDAARAEVGADEGPVGVARAAVEQLVAAQDDRGARQVTTHRRAGPRADLAGPGSAGRRLTGRCRTVGTALPGLLSLPGMRMRPRALRK